MDIQQYKQQVADICRQNSIRSCYLFGSARTSAFGEHSDVDLVISFISDGGDYFERFMNAKQELETIFKHPVDLLVYESIRNPYLKNEVEETKELIYAA